MATYVKGNPVENATRYELFEKVGSNYTSLATGNEINFEVSALGLSGGDHVLAVKAYAEGYADSEYSNELVYTVQKTYDSYIGAEVFKNVLRIESNGSAWVENATGSALSTDLIEVSYTDKVWIQYVFIKSAQFGVGGFYDADGNLVKPIVSTQFGIPIDTTVGGGAAAFATVPETSMVSIADIEAQAGKAIKYVKFTAWPSSAGGLENTEARIYHS